MPISQDTHRQLIDCAKTFLSRLEGLITYIETTARTEPPTSPIHTIAEFARSCRPTSTDILFVGTEDAKYDRARMKANDNRKARHRAARYPEQERKALQQRNELNTASYGRDTAFMGLLHAAVKTLQAAIKNNPNLTQEQAMALAELHNKETWPEVIVKLYLQEHARLTPQHAEGAPTQPTPPNNLLAAQPPNPLDHLKILLTTTPQTTFLQALIACKPASGQESTKFKELYDSLTASHEAPPAEPSPNAEPPAPEPTKWQPQHYSEVQPIVIPPSFLKGT